MADLPIAVLWNDPKIKSVQLIGFRTDSFSDPTPPDHLRPQPVLLPREWHYEGFGAHREGNTVILANARFRLLQERGADWLDCDVAILDGWRSRLWAAWWPVRRAAADLDRRLRWTAYIWGLLDPPASVMPTWRDFRPLKWWLRRRYD